MERLDVLPSYYVPRMKWFADKMRRSTTMQTWRSNHDDSLRWGIHILLGREQNQGGSKKKVRNQHNVQFICRRVESSPVESMDLWHSPTHLIIPLKRKELYSYLYIFIWWCSKKNKRNLPNVKCCAWADLLIVEMWVFLSRITWEESKSVIAIIVHS